MGWAVRVIVCGSRNLTDVLAIESALRALDPRPTVLVHGAARGVDTIAALWATRNGIAVEAHPAEWDAYGRGAGPRRNSHMASLGADLCVAIFADRLDPKSGTADMLRKARRAGIRTREVWV